jgi:hypothetical protein
MQNAILKEPAAVQDVPQIDELSERKIRGNAR